jgi:hypothetical protein
LTIVTSQVDSELDLKFSAGAGFLNAYNTQDRSDRRMLQVFVRTGGEETFATELLPRPTTDAGTYLFGFDGQLFSKGRGAIDNKLRVWRQQDGHWEVDKQTIPFSVHVAGKIMSATSQLITYDGRPILELAPEQGQIGEWYYGDGKLIVRQNHPGPESAINELIALDWTSSDSTPLRIENGVKLALSAPHEFIYAFGQHCKELVAASNMGGVHVVDGENWRTLREPDGKSFQIYSTLSTENRLLLGQYPTGEPFELAGKKLQRLPGWPPVMKGVSSNAREAQTLALYGGDLVFVIVAKQRRWFCDIGDGDGSARCGATWIAGEPRGRRGRLRQRCGRFPSAQVQLSRRASSPY